MIHIINMLGYTFQIKLYLLDTGYLKIFFLYHGLVTCCLRKVLHLKFWF